MMDNENRKRAYAALQKAATRIQTWHWHTNPNCRARHNKRTGKLIKQFIPDECGLLLCEASGDVLSGKITPDEAMTMLHIGETAYRLKMARDAGF